MAALPAMGSQSVKMGEAAAAIALLVHHSFTLADVYLMPIVFYMNRQPEGGALLGWAERLKAYFERHIVPPNIRRSIPESRPCPAR